MLFLRRTLIRFVILFNIQISSSLIAMNFILEVAVFNIESVLLAAKAGADRIELCENPYDGGTTPSYGTLKKVREKINIPVFPIVRARGGDFLYSDEEFEVMKKDVALIKDLGFEGVVIGLLKKDGTIDILRTTKLVEIAYPLEVTFHRAFDVSTDLSKSLEDVITTGAKRILTSGGEPSALKGAESLAKLVRQSAGRIIILAAGSIKGSNAREIVEKTGVQEVHAGLRTVISGRMKQSNKNISPGVTGMDESQRFVVLEENVKKLKQALI